MKCKYLATIKKTLSDLGFNTVTGLNNTLSELWNELRRL